MALSSTYQSTGLPLLSTLYEPPPKHLISVLGPQTQQALRWFQNAKGLVLRFTISVQVTRAGEPMDW